MGKFLKTYEILFHKAKVDLNSAKILLKSFENGEVELDLEIIMFHLQQCAEKLLKTLLDYNQIKFPHSHDLEKLYQLCNEEDIDLMNNIEILLPLSDYAVEGRYSIIHDDIDSAEKYIKILEKFVEFIKKEII